MHFERTLEGERRRQGLRCVSPHKSSYVNKIDVHITLQSQDDSKPSVALCLRPSDKMKNAEITLMNLAHTLLGVHPSNDSNLAEKVNTIFDAAKRVAESKVCQSLMEVGYSITAFVEFGDSIAEVRILMLITGYNLTLVESCVGKPIPEVSMVHNDSIHESKSFSGTY